MNGKALIVLLCAIVTAHAEEARKVTHDGAEMTLTKFGDNGLEIAYGIDIPAPLRELGVMTGTVLVRGNWDDKTLVGEAWAFSPDCKAGVSYPVLGVVDYDSTLVVFGPVPRSCKANSDSSWGKEALMRFEVPQRNRPAARPKQAEAKPKPKPKSKPAPRPKAVAPRPAAPTYYWPQQYPSQFRW